MEGGRGRGREGGGGGREGGGREKKVRDMYGGELRKRGRKAQNLKLPFHNYQAELRSFQLSSTHPGYVGISGGDVHAPIIHHVHDRGHARASTAASVAIGNCMYTCSLHAVTFTYQDIYWGQRLNWSDPITVIILLGRAWAVLDYRGISFQGKSVSRTSSKYGTHLNSR